jgi:TonB family protein
MGNNPLNFEERNPETLKKDRSILYMAIILGFVILVMAYFTLFSDDPWSKFQKQENIVSLAGDQAKSLEKNESLSDEELQESLTKFIQAFYYDQKKGYFDPPSYFAPITKTFYNFHNLTYESLKDLYWRRMADMKKLESSWIVSTLAYERTDSGIVANYWSRERYFRPSLNRQESADIKYEIIIDKDGKIFSFREAEIKNFQTYAGAKDSIIQALPVSPIAKPSTVPEKDLKTYDVSMVNPIPQFPGGQAQLTRFLQTNLRYPALAKEKKIQGNVYASFFIEKDGSLRNIEIKQGLGNGCDEEAIRLIRSFPSWTPGMLNGNAVTTFYVLPVPFQLN